MRNTLMPILIRACRGHGVVGARFNLAGGPGFVSFSAATAWKSYFDLLTTLGMTGVPLCVRYY
jgi:hypothetical protein